VEGLSRSGVPLTFVGYAVADVLFAEAAVVLSMQELTNYPSRVVAEALMAGCAVVVRDTGDSREFGNDLPGLFYCRGELDPAEIADQLALLLSSAVLDPGMAENVREAALRRFSSKRYVEYFRCVMAGQTA
jgi:glycosyltransferase involved in cell wall biosynthesis